MKIHCPNLRSCIGLLLATFLLAGCTTTNSHRPASLKDTYKKYFYVGVAINRNMATGTTNQDDLFARTPEQNARDIALIKEQFNQIAPENDLKWAVVQPQPGPDGYNFGPADAYVDFGLTNKMYLVGHTLVWHNQTPNWVFAGTNPPPASPGAPAATNASSPSLAASTNAAEANMVETNAAGTNISPPLIASTTNSAETNVVVTNATGSDLIATNSTGTNAAGRGRFGRGFGRGGFVYNGPRASREELLQRMHDHIFAVVGRYKGQIKVWDVVNEAVSESGTNVLRKSLWLQIIGPDYIAKAFEYAHEADPHAILRYNDFGLENPTKRHKFIALIKSLQKQHVPVMAIGSQTHVSVSSPGFKQEDQALTELETLGLPIHITELDVNLARGGQRDTAAEVADNAATTQGGLVTDADQRLANQYSNLFKVFIKHQKYVKIVTFWGVNDAVSWRARGKPLLFDANDQPKPAFDAVMRAATEAQK